MTPTSTVTHTMSGSCRATERLRACDGSLVPVFTITWHAPDGPDAKVLGMGLPDGSFVGRLALEDEAGT